jgi:hypothetical protein
LPRTLRLRTARGGGKFFWSRIAPVFDFSCAESVGNAGVAGKLTGLAQVQVFCFDRFS